MREHEVPTHVQAEDRVLLGFTFPQVVAVTAVCAISYGAYRYAPVGPSEVRMALAVVFGLVGIAMTVGKIGGRRLPLVAADLLKYRLGARRYAGQVSQLIRTEPPASAQPVKSGPGPVSLMAKRVGRGLGRLRKNRKTRKNKERRNGRMRWFGKRRGKDGGNRHGQDHRAETLETRNRKPRMGWIPVVAVVAVMAAAVMAVPQLALADSHEPWRDEIDFEITEPVEGRRIFVEGLTVSGDRALVTLRAATAVDIRIRAFGGPDGTWLRFWASDRLGEGELSRYGVPPARTLSPSFTDLVGGQPGAGRCADGRTRPDTVPAPRSGGRALRPAHDLPGLDARSRQRRGRVGVRDAHRAPRRASDGGRTRERHRDGAHGRPGDGDCTGTLSAATGASTASVEFVPEGETQFRLDVPTGEAIHAVSVDVSLEASLRIPIPPLTVLTHHPERTERRHRDRAALWRPGASDYRQRDDHRDPRRRHYDVRTPSPPTHTCPAHDGLPGT